MFLQWTQLQHRKQSLKKLFQRMVDWQFEKVRNEPDKALTEDNRAIQDEDIQRYAHICINQTTDMVCVTDDNPLWCVELLL